MALRNGGAWVATRRSELGPYSFRSMQKSMASMPAEFGGAPVSHTACTPRVQDQETAAGDDRVAATSWMMRHSTTQRPPPSGILGLGHNAAVRRPRNIFPGSVKVFAFSAWGSIEKPFSSGPLSKRCSSREGRAEGKITTEKGPKKRITAVSRSLQTSAGAVFYVEEVQGDPLPALRLTGAFRKKRVGYLRIIRRRIRSVALLC